MHSHKPQSVTQGFKDILLRLLLVVSLTQLPSALALSPNDAEAVYKDFNEAFLIRSDGDVFYKDALNTDKQSGTWAGSLNILGAQDAYERTGDPDKKTLINELLTTWLKATPPYGNDDSDPWEWDGWNDDLGWFTLALVRGHQMTGNADFLAPAKAGFDYAFRRGWDTKYNDGGIWEENPEYAAREKPPKEPTKEALSNDSLGKVACMLYQSTHDGQYLDRATQIYAWVSKNLFNHETGQVNAGIHMDGKLNTGTAVYNQGTFIDYAHLLYTITGKQEYHDDAKKALDFGRASLTANGIFSRSDDYLNTWADEFARGAGHFVRDHRLWADYHDWMVANADAILENRRADRGITWNGWDKPTPKDDSLISNKFVSAVAWLQFTPAAVPGEVQGLHAIVNQQSGLAIDHAGSAEDGKLMELAGVNGSLNQRWLLTQNSDSSWNIVNPATGKALSCLDGSKEDGIEIAQWAGTRNGDQRWVIEAQNGGMYKISNQASGKVLDGGKGVENGTLLVQSEWTGGEEQMWVLQ
ncbi:MAG: hypothetical protein Q9211_000398 [Gyalolechia sp. 1 TL-2023]